MADIVLFDMDSGFRAQLIERHEFFVQHARLRLLDQFTDDAISEDADRAADESWERRGEYFDPNSDDPGDGVEAAYEDGVWRYQLLTDLRDSVRMIIIAGFFHEWEKNLRQWLVDQIKHWHSGDAIKDKIWTAKIEEIFELLESFGWPLKSMPWFSDLDACRLIVNVFKHGDGPALNNLAKRFPNFIDHPFSSFEQEISKSWMKPSHNYLKVTDDDIDRFNSAIVEFWKGVPENVSQSQVDNPPGWFLKALEKG